MKKINIKLYHFEKKSINIQINDKWSKTGRHSTPYYQHFEN